MCVINLIVFFFAFRYLCSFWDILVEAEHVRHASISTRPWCSHISRWQQNVIAYSV